MDNLAGILPTEKVDKQIVRELTEAGIHVEWLREPNDGEVAYSATGYLSYFTFKRAWYYWIVKGRVPYDIAVEMYEGSEIGKKFVRVAGHCACVHPKEWAFPIDHDLFLLGVYKLPSKEHPYGDGPNYGDLAKMCNDGTINAPRFVDTYHIDTQEGLNLFAETVRKHSLM